MRSDDVRALVRSAVLAGEDARAKMLEAERAIKGMNTDLLHEVVQLKSRVAELEAKRSRHQRECVSRQAQMRSELKEARQATDAIASLLASDVHTVEASANSIKPNGYYVYCLWDAEGVCVYVGQSTNIFGRLGQHARDPEKGPVVVRVTLTECPSKHAMDRIERALIRQCQPRLNRAGLDWKVWPPLTDDERQLIP